MNLPNLLTIIRIFLVPLLVAGMVQQNLHVRVGDAVLVSNNLFALVVFLAAALTDLLDGYLARRWKQVTTVGTLLDPIADKLLISAALISLVQIRILPGWMVILIISREFAVSGLRSIAAAEGYTIKAGELGKTKMVMQVIGVTLAMLTIRWPKLDVYTMATMWIVVVFSIASAVDYFYKFWRKVDTSIKLRRRNELLQMDRQKRRLLKAEAQKERAERKSAANAIRRSV